MLMVTTENISGKTLVHLGLVKGCVVQSKHLGKDIAAGFRTLIGGEMKGYTEMMNEARALATKRMAEDAEKMSADAIVCVRYVSSAITQGAAEVVAFGTAVKFG